MVRNEPGSASASTNPAMVTKVMATTRIVSVGLIGLMLSMVVSVARAPLYMFRPMTAMRPG